MCIYNISDDRHIYRDRNNYTLRTDGVCGTRSISTLPECSQAAAVLGLPDVTASYDFDGGLDHLPSFCYFFNGTLRFHAFQQNTGECSNDKKCLCREDAAPQDPALLHDTVKGT